MSVDVSAPQNKPFASTIAHYAIYRIVCLCAYTVALISVLVNQCLSTGKFVVALNFLEFALIIGVFVTEYCYKSAKEKSEQVRRNGLLDNSFGSKFETSDAIGYYDNDNIGNGIRKLLLNIHENSFHTAYISKKMLCLYNIILIPSVLLLLAFAYFGFMQIILAPVVLDVFLSATLIGRYLDLRSLHEASEKIFSDAQKISELADEDEAQVFAIVLEYESAITTANVILSKRIYIKNQEFLKSEWLKVQERYYSK